MQRNKGTKMHEKSKTKKTKSNSEVKKSNVFNYDNVIEVDVVPKKKVNKKDNKYVENKTQKKSVQKDIKKKEKKSPQKSSKNKKPKKKINTEVISLVLKIFALITIIIGTIIFLMVSPVFNITEIEITNNKKISKDMLISLSKIKYGENIFRINKKGIISNIKENPYVEDIKITRDLPNKVVIDVRERTAKFMLAVADKYMYIDNQGYMLELSKEKIELPIILGIETKEDEIKENNRLCEADLEKLNKVIEIYQVASTKELAGLISKIDISNKLNYKLVLESEKKNIYLGDGTDLANKFTWIKKILEDQKDKEGDIHANRPLNSQPPYFAPKK